MVTQRFEQAFGSDVVLKLKEAQVERQFSCEIPDGVATTSATTTRTPRRCFDMDLVNAVAGHHGRIRPGWAHRPMVGNPTLASGGKCYSSVYTRVPGAMNRSISGRIVTCRTFSSIWITTALPCWIIRKSAAFRCPGRRARACLTPVQPAPPTPAAFFHRVRMPFVTGHGRLRRTPLPDQDPVRVGGDDPVLQLLGHALNVIGFNPNSWAIWGIRGSSP